MSTLSKPVLPTIWGVDQYSKGIYFLSMVGVIQEELSTRTCLKPHMETAMGRWKLEGCWVLSLKLSILPISMRVLLSCIPSTTLATCPRWCWNSSKNIYPRSSLHHLIYFSFMGQVWQASPRHGEPLLDLGQTLCPGTRLRYPTSGTLASTQVHERWALVASPILCWI